MELSTPNYEWGQKEVSNLTISIYKPDEDCKDQTIRTESPSQNLNPQTDFLEIRFIKNQPYGLIYKGKVKNKNLTFPLFFVIIYT